MFIHGSIGTEAISNSPALKPQFNVPPDPHGSTPPCSGRGIGDPIPLPNLSGSKVQGAEDVRLFVAVIGMRSARTQFLSTVVVFFFMLGLRSAVCEVSENTIFLRWLVFS